jgi:hypothetical protein
MQSYDVPAVIHLTKVKDMVYVGSSHMRYSMFRDAQCKAVNAGRRHSIWVSQQSRNTKLGIDTPAASEVTCERSLMA